MIIKIKGLSDLHKNLNQLSKNMENSIETKSVPVMEVLNSEFLAKHTKFENINEFFKAGGFDQMTFESIPRDKLDSFVSSVSPFGSWLEMCNAACADWAKSKLNPK